MKLFTTTLLTFIFTITISYAQTIDSKIVDPYGFVTKYDTTFNGIGPSVYILPLPRTLKDEMIDTYKEIQTFQEFIRSGFQNARLLSFFKPTSNAQNIHKIIPDTLVRNELENLIQSYEIQKNHVIVYGLYNILALELLKQNNKKEAIESLKIALSQALLVNQTDDIAIIQSNLASIYLLTNQYGEALALENAYLLHAMHVKNLANQASSQARIALIHAYIKDYRTAENTIIRKAIPLFNKSKFYGGKIEAWIILAEIYRNQNKHTEAQWFLLQAKDLAKEKGYDEKIATIEYMLGSSKLIQSNYKIAKKELEQAWKLAQNSPNKYLQLAIAEQLGRSYVYLKDYETAKNYLDHYWTLRNLLF